MAPFVAVAFTSVISLIYLTGYTYLDGYYATFEIEVPELGYSIQDIFVHSAPPIKTVLADIYKNPTNQLINVLLFLILILFLGRTVQTRTIPTRPLTWSAALIFALSACFVTFTWLTAAKIGKERAESQIGSLNLVKLTTKEDSRLNLNTGTQQLHHIISTKDMHFLLLTYENGEDRWVIRVPKEATTSLRAYQD